MQNTAFDDARGSMLLGQRALVRPIVAFLVSALGTRKHRTFGHRVECEDEWQLVEFSSHGAAAVGEILLVKASSPAI